MSTKKLKVMKCPTCGGDLRSANDGKEMVCVYCENVIVPVDETPAVVQKENNTANGGSVRIEGIKTPSSALAYMEQFFEEYDWEAFSYSQSLSVSAMDRLADSLKITSADDKKTWFVCFKAIYVPFSRKAEFCKNILESIVKSYKNGDLDAYSKFDAYKRITDDLRAGMNDIIAKLGKILCKAEKYGASADEIAELEACIKNIKGLCTVNIYSDIESVPEIIAFINEKNTYIAQTLASKGIDAQREYDKAKYLIREKKYVEALHTLRLLQGYSDSHSLIEQLDKYFLISDVLEIGGKLYLYKKSNADSAGLNLYPAIDSKFSDKPVIEDIDQIITNYADILYYLGNDRTLYKFDFSANVKTKLYNNRLSKKNIHVYGRRVFLVGETSGDFDNKTNIVELDTPTGNVKVLIENIKAATAFNGNKIVYSIAVPKSETQDAKTEYMTCILDVNTMRSITLGMKDITVEGYIKNCAVYTRIAPNEYNRDLYIKSLTTDEPERLIEANIFRFCNIIENKIFYYIGNSNNETLININPDGTQRQEWGHYTSKLLFSQGGWIYYIRSAGYTSILCKSKLGTDDFTVIATDIEEFIEIKNGYLYYIDGDSDLMKVRMDGSNLQTLCDDVDTVLSVKENKIVFISSDDTIIRGEGETRRSKDVKSIYAVDFTGSGRCKLAYDVKTAKAYDENTVYYISSEKTDSLNDEEIQLQDVLYKLDVETNTVQKLICLNIQKQASGCSGFAIAMTISLISFLIGFIALGTENAGLGVTGMIVGVFSLIIGVILKYGKSFLE